jgi:hypothetical protein
MSIFTVAQTRLNLRISPSDVCKDVADSVAKFFKVNVQGEHVHNIAFAKKNVTPVPINNGS